MAKYCFGIDVGGTTVKCGLFESDGTLLEKWEIPTRTENAGSNILPDIAETILGKIGEKGIAKKDVAGVGIGIPGPVRDGVAFVAVNLHWDETDVAGILGGLTGFPVKVGNDVNVAAMGELWQGGAKGHRNAVVVALGTGVGGGIIVDGKLIEGAHGGGGEIGHMHVDDELKEPCNCGNCGCLEQFASATGVVRLAREELIKKPKSEKTILSEEDLSSKSVFDAYKDGDAVADRVVNRFAKYLGTGLAAVAAVADPEVIVVGGGVSKAGECLTDIVTRYYKVYSFNASKNTPIVLAKLGNDAGIYGCAKLVLD